MFEERDWKPESLYWKLKEEVEKRARIHELVILDYQKKDQIIADYHIEMKRWHITACSKDYCLYPCSYNSLIAIRSLGYDIIKPFDKAITWEYNYTLSTSGYFFKCVEAIIVWDFTTVTVVSFNLFVSYQPLCVLLHYSA